MKILQVFLLLCLFAPNLSEAALRIEGTLHREGEKLYVVLGKGPVRSLLLNPASEIEKEALDRLGTGDYLIGSGRISGDQAHLESLHFVGLKKLLGIWKSRNWELFDFRSFEELFMYWRVHFLKDSKIAVKSFNYSLAPDQESHWSMILVDKESVDIARIRFMDELLIVEMLDTDGGPDRHTFYLSPLH